MMMIAQDKPYDIQYMYLKAIKLNLLFNMKQWFVIGLLRVILRYSCK